MKLDEAVDCLDTCGVEKTKNQRIFDIWCSAKYSTFMSIYLGGNEMRIKSMVKSRTMGVEAQKMTTAEVSWGS